jgi:hypothetical protein
MLGGLEARQRTGGWMRGIPGAFADAKHLKFIDLKSALPPLMPPGLT